MAKPEEAAQARAFIQALVSADHEPCTGVTATCPEMECLECGARECPHGEPLHFHHDGCPVCAFAAPA